MSLESEILAALAEYTTDIGDDPAPFFATTGGPADHVAALEQAPALPAAFVVLEDIETGPNELIRPVRQLTTETVAVWIAVGNTLDGLGETAVGDARAALAAVDAALIGLQISDSNYSPIEKAGGRLIGYDRGTLWRVAYFTAQHLVTGP